MTGSLDLAAAARRLRAAGERAVLATLVAVEGSSVRRPGARLMIRADGTVAGFLSAGCVESDLAARAERVRTTGSAETISYGAGELADPVFGLGLGCGGGLRILLEAWPPAAPPDPLRLMESVRASRRPAGLATLVEPQEFAGARAAVDPGGRLLVDAPRALEDSLISLARRAWEGASGLHGAAPLTVFLERLVPPVRVLSCGHTPPALALCRLAGDMGWDVVLWSTDTLPTGGAVPRGTRVVRGEPGSMPPGVRLDEWTAVAMFTHDTGREAALVPRLAASSVPYVGIMGSRSRRRSLLHALSAAVPPESLRGILHMPIGLDIGAETAEEIALAAAAQIASSFRHRPGGSLFDGDGDCHEH